MRVLHLINAFNRGGLESWLLSMLREIPRDVCAIDVCCKGGDTGPWAPLAEQLHAEVFHCPLEPTHLRFLRGFRRILRSGSYDIVHNHLDVYSGFPVWIAKKEQVPVICTFHNTDFSKAHPWWLRLPAMEQLRSAYGYVSMRYAIRRADLVTAVSRGVLRVVTSGRTVLGAKPRVLYLGVSAAPPATRDERSALRRSLGFPENTPLILHVGRFMELKNHKGLIAIFKLVSEAIREAKLLLVGEGILRPSIERLVRQRGLGDSVVFLGRRDDVPALMARCDLFLLPSLFEGLPIVALEANAAGLPVVGSKVPGLVEAVEHGASGILHEINDIEGMANSAIMLLTRPDRARALGLEGRNRIENFFGVKAAAGRLLELYSGLLNEMRSEPLPAGTDRAGLT